MKSISNSIACVSISLSFFLTSSSCQKKDNIYYVSLNDSVQQAIKSYVTQNNIDIKSRVITTDWLVNPYRTDVYLSNTFRKFSNTTDYVPSYYSIVSDSILVLVYTGTETAIVRNTQNIQTEIENLLIEKDIKLQPDDHTVVHEETWLYSSCGGWGKLVREPSITDLLYIPCRSVKEKLVE